jgi:transcriptional regulator with XRE-family HTH domain
LLNIEKAEEVQIAFALRKNRDISRKRLLRKIGLSQVEIDENEQELVAEGLQQAGAAALVSAASGKGHGKK